MESLQHIGFNDWFQYHIEPDKLIIKWGQSIIVSTIREYCALTLINKFLLGVDLSDHYNFWQAGYNAAILQLAEDG